METGDFWLSKDDQAVLDHVSGLTRVLPGPIAPVCEDRQYVGELVAMRAQLGAMAIHPPKMRLTFDDVLKAAADTPAEPKDNRIIYWLTGRWGIGLVTAASVTLAFITGVIATARTNYQYAAAKGDVSQHPSRKASLADRAPEPQPELPWDAHDGKVAGGGGQSGDQVDISLYGSIVRQGSIHLRHADPASVQRLVTELVTSSGGMVTNLTRQGSGEYTNVTISVAVPADKYRDFKGKVAGYGEVLNENESTEDVTSEQVDFKARLAEAEDYLTRLDKLIETPTDLSSLQNLERERRNTRLEIERYRKAISSLESRVALSRLDISITASEPQTIEPRGEFARAFDDGLEGLEAVTAWMLRAGLAGSPFLALGAVAYLFLRRKRKQLKQEERLAA